MPHDWPSEPDLVPYVAQVTLPLRHLLVLAPHPDDEVLGCGGLIASTLRAGAAVTIVVASDGAQAGDAATRQAESRAAARMLAGDGPQPDLQFWGLPDRGLADDPSLVPRLQHLLGSCDADGVLLPSPFEVHPDHRALCLGALLAARSTACAAELWCYEIGQPLLADVLVDITAVLPIKRAALQCFASQLAAQAYDEQLLALNRFRAYTLGSQVSHAEALQHLPRDQWRAGLDAVIRAVGTRLHRRFGGGTADR